MPRLGNEVEAPRQLSWRGRIMRKRWWWIVRPFINLFLGIALLFAWDPPSDR